MGVQVFFTINLENEGEFRSFRNPSISCVPTPSLRAHGSRAGCSAAVFQHAAQAPALRGGDTFHREEQEPIKFRAVRTILAFVSSPVKQPPLKREEGADRPRTLPKRVKLRHYVEESFFLDKFFSIC